MKKERKGKHFIKKPIYKGGPKALQQFIGQQMQYPKAAVDNKIEGTVTIRYTINHLGKVTDTKIINGLGYGCDEEADRLVRLLVFEVPKNRGVRATFHKDLHIHFRLPKSPTVQYQYQLSASKQREEVEENKEKKGGGYTIQIEW